MKLLKRFSMITGFVLFGIVLTTTGNTSDYFDDVGRLLDKRVGIQKSQGTSGLDLARYRPAQRYF